jgi:WD40 repeat protein
VVDTWGGHAGRVFGPALTGTSQPGGAVYTTSLDGTVMRWDLTADRRLGVRVDLGSGWFVAPDAPSTPAAGDWVVAVVLADGTVEVREGQLGFNQADTIPAGEGKPPNALAFADEPYPARLAAAGPAGVVIHTPEGPGTDAPLVVPTEAAARSVDFGPDGTVWAGFDDGTIAAWDAVRGGEPIQTLVAPAGGESIVSSVSISPDGDLLLATHGPNATVWRLADDDPLYTVQADADEVRAFAAAFAPDGATFATGSADGFVRFWDADSGERVGREIKSSAGDVLSLDYRPDGRVLLTGGSDGTARLIDVETQTEIGVPLPGTDNIPAYAYYFDQRNIFVMQPDGSGVLWFADPNSWKQRACSIAGRSLTEEEWERFLPGRPYEPACASP